MSEPTISRLPSLTASNQTTIEGDVYLGDLRYNIVGGQGNFNQINVVNDSNVPGSRGFDILCDHIADNALHNCAEVSAQPKCHPGTREAILKYLLEWAAVLDSPFFVEWLHGPAGTGKSSILRTIAQRLFEKNLLLGSFFFFRTSEKRNTSRYVASTLAYQLALVIPETRKHIGKAVETNPKIFSLSLWDQALVLMISPLVSVFYDPAFDCTRYPRVLVVDGLDECGDSVEQCQVLDVLRRIVQNVPFSLSVLVASRPEHHIRDAFSFKDLNQCSSRLALDETYEPDQDIRRYLIDKFDALRQGRSFQLPSEKVWPSYGIINGLVAKASGQFIYASTIVKFVSSPRHNPVERLNVIINAENVGKQKPFKDLDALYSTIFRSMDPDDLAPALRIVGFLLIPGLDRLPDHRTYNVRCPAFIECFLQLKIGDVRRILFDLESLLTVQSNNIAIQFFHASLSDYLFDQSRSGPFWIDPSLIYADIIEKCIVHAIDRPELQLFLVEEGDIFSQTAQSTVGLRRAIENCDLEKVVAGAWISELFGIKYVCPFILQLARDKLTPEYFVNKMHCFQEIPSVASRIAIYLKNPHLKTFLIATTILARNPGSLKMDSRTADLFLPEPDLEAEENEGFDLRNENGFSPIIQFLDFLQNDPGGTYFVDEVQYADVTLHLMKDCFRPYLFNSAFQNEALNVVFPFLFSKSCIRSDIVNIIKDIMLTQFPTASSETYKAMQAYISRAEASQPRNDLNTKPSSLKEKRRPTRYFRYFRLKQAMKRLSKMLRFS